MDIAGKFQQIGIGIQQDGLGAPLKQMPHPFLLLVQPTGVAKAKILHDPG